MIKMKALRSFGVPGANEGKVKRGREFSAATDGRAKDLEEHGLAHRVDVKIPDVQNRMIPESTKAAQAGPLDSPGGTTGADAPAPSSLPDPAPRRRKYPRSKAAPDLLS